MSAVFAILIRAIQKRSWRLTALAGGMTGILAGVYFPVFAIAALAGVCGMAILLIRARLTGDKVRWQVPVCYVASGLVLGLQNAWWLLIDGGLHAWSAQLPAGRVKFDSITASFQSLTGSVSLWPNAPFEPWWSRVAVVVASLAVLLLLVGAVSLIRRDLLAAACLVPPLLAGAIIYVHGAGGSASVLIVAYLSPIACALAAYGVARLIAMRSTASRSTRPQRYAHHPRARGYAASTVVLIAALVVILALRTGSAYEGEAFAINSGGILPRADLGLSRLGSAVPPRAGVLMYTVAGPVQDIQHATNMLAEAALLLPDRNVAIIGALAPSKASTTVDQAAPGYPYILSYSEGGAPDSSVPSSYRAVLRLPRQNLVLYERAGATT
jgi:hypothetical protein